jgi:predicted metal-dependent TIM-barrel fold hydrolase
MWWMMNQTNNVTNHLKLVSNLSADEFADAVEFEVIQTAAVGLLKRWFPRNIPTDIEKWSEIAYEDVVAMLRALDEEGYTINKKDERTDK